MTTIVLKMCVPDDAPLPAWVIAESLRKLANALGASVYVMWIGGPS